MDYATIKTERKGLRLRRREQARREYFPAQRAAVAIGFTLVLIDNEDHYRLRGPFGWTWDIRVSSHFIKTWRNTPRLDLPGDWSLGAVVSSAARMVATRP